MGNMINTIKAVAALDKAITPVLANMVTKGLENKTDEEAMEAIMEIAAPLRGLIENGLKAMGQQIVPIEDGFDDEDDDGESDYYSDDEEETGNDTDITIEVHDHEDPDEVETENLIEFLQNTQVALGLDREDLYKLLLIMGVKNIVPTDVHKWATTCFNEYF